MIFAMFAFLFCFASCGHSLFVAVAGPAALKQLNTLKTKRRVWSCVCVVCEIRDPFTWIKHRALQARSQLCRTKEFRKETKLGQSRQYWPGSSAVESKRRWHVDICRTRESVWHWIHFHRLNETKECSLIKPGTTHVGTFQCGTSRGCHDRAESLSRTMEKYGFHRKYLNDFDQNVPTKASFYFSGKHWEKNLRKSRNNWSHLAHS